MKINAHRWTAGARGFWLSAALLVGVVFPYQLWLRGNEVPLIDYLAQFENAKALVSGDFQGSVNGYWSPLLVWLMALGLLVSDNEPLILILLSTGCGLLSWAMVWRLTAEWLAEGTTRFVARAALASLIVMMCITVVVPDHLAVVLILAYFRCYLAQRSAPTRRGQFVLGGLIAFAYYVKAYALIALLLHQGISLLWQNQEPGTFRQRLKRRASVFLLVLILVLPWTVVLKGKYGHWTWSTSGSYNRFLVQEKYQQVWRAHPYANPARTPLLPTADQVHNRWEDPSTYPLPPAPSFNWAHHAAILFWNLKDWLIVTLRFSLFFFPLVLVWFVRQVFGRAPPSPHDRVIREGVLFSLLYPSGFVFFFYYQERYFWPPLLLAACLTIVLWAQVSQRLHRKQRLLGVLLIGVTLMMPLGQRILFDYGMARYVDPPACVAEDVARPNQVQLEPGGLLVCDDPMRGFRLSEAFNLRMAELDLRAESWPSEQALVDTLRKHRIRYVFLTNQTPLTDERFSQYSEIAQWHDCRPLRILEVPRH